MDNLVQYVTWNLTLVGDHPEKTEIKINRTLLQDHFFYNPDFILQHPDMNPERMLLFQLLKNLKNLVPSGNLFV